MLTVNGLFRPNCCCGDCNSIADEDLVHLPWMRPEEAYEPIRELIALGLPVKVQVASGPVGRFWMIGNGDHACNDEFGNLEHLVIVGGNQIEDERQSIFRTPYYQILKGFLPPNYDDNSTTFKQTGDGFRVLYSDGTDITTEDEWNNVYQRYRSVKPFKSPCHCESNQVLLFQASQCRPKYKIKSFVNKRGLFGTATGMGDCLWQQITESVRHQIPKDGGAYLTPMIIVATRYRLQITLYHEAKISFNLPKNLNYLAAAGSVIAAHPLSIKIHLGKILPRLLRRFYFEYFRESVVINTDWINYPPEAAYQAVGGPLTYNDSPSVISAFLHKISKQYGPVSDENHGVYTPLIKPEKGYVTYSDFYDNRLIAGSFPLHSCVRQQFDSPVSNISMQLPPQQLTADIILTTGFREKADDGRILMTEDEAIKQARKTFKQTQTDINAFISSHKCHLANMVLDAVFYGE